MESKTQVFTVGATLARPIHLVFFNGGGHVGIYIGRNKLIDAPHSGSVVHISTMSGWYSYDYNGARRILPS